MILNQYSFINSLFDNLVTIKQSNILKDNAINYPLDIFCKSAWIMEQSTFGNLAQRRVQIKNMALLSNDADFKFMGKNIEFKASIQKENKFGARQLNFDKGSKIDEFWFWFIETQYPISMNNPTSDVKFVQHRFIIPKMELINLFPNASNGHKQATHKSIDFKLNSSNWQRIQRYKTDLFKI